MKRGVVQMFLMAVTLLVLVPAAAYAQEGQIAGVVRDPSSAVMPGVTVEVTSPALIERVRSTTTDPNGAYRITNLPVGTYKVTFTLSGFAKQERENVVLTSGFTASVNATMTVGQVSETVVVSGAAPVVDVQNSREVITLPGDRIRDMPTSRNVNSLLELTPALTSQYTTSTSQTPFGAPGVCVGGIGVFCNPGISGFNIGDRGTALDQANMAQGRVLVDGVVVNQGGSTPIVGQTGGYTADIANSQEVNIRVSGALGESENGASEINIVPRTGGNRFGGDFFLSYTTESWFGTNNGAFPGLPAAFQPVKSDHDWSADYGGPIVKDRLWFFGTFRDQYIHKLPVGVDFWPNLNQGKYGYNYEPDVSQPRVEYENMWRSGSGRVTYQASQKNKFNIYWDEQLFCQDPCTGVVSVYTSPESWISVQTKPDRLQQVTWTNPATNHILLEAGLSVETQFYDTSHSRNYTDYVDIPRVSEIGAGTTGLYLNPATGTMTPVNAFAGSSGLFALTSGSINNGPGGLFETRNQHYWRQRASISYVSGSHHAKFGYDGGYYKQLETNTVNNSLMTFNYTAPSATTNCLLPTHPCGNTSLQFPTDPFNLTRRPVPNTVQWNVGATTYNDSVRYDALYAQDQWTLKRLTLGAALRFDHATSGFGSSCFGPNQFVTTAFCTSAGNGVNYKDLTPRVAVAWDVTGSGKTAVKFSMGKYNNAAAIGGFYSGANPAHRVVGTLQRSWNDTNGDRHVDCNLMNPANNGECGAFSFGQSDIAHFGQDPGTVGLTTIQCGRTDPGISPLAQAYCNQYGQSVLNGWGDRRGEWQYDLGVQREVLPRLTAEIQYHRRNYTNLTASDQLTIGCDRFNGTTSMAACESALLGYSNPSYDFFSVQAPVDPKLPGGGGYTITGLADVHQLVTAPATVQTYWTNLNYTWNSVDTNFNWRGPRSIFVQAGTSTARTQRNTCNALTDLSNVNNSLNSIVGHSDAPYAAGCISNLPFQTTVRGSATYTIPKADVLVSFVYQSLPGAELTANWTVSKDQVTWNNPARATAPCALAANGTGCFLNSNNFASPTTWSVPLLLNGQMFGERVTTMDIKLAKNIRFHGKRLNVGADIYNFLNSDAITSYNTIYTPGPTNAWGTPMGLVSPRFVRLQIQANF